MTTILHIMAGIVAGLALLAIVPLLKRAKRAMRPRQSAAEQETQFLAMRDASRAYFAHCTQQIETQKYQYEQVNR